METIVSVDVETDGRIPGKNSMRQLAALAYDLQGREVSRFCRNVLPLPTAKEDPETMQWWSEQEARIQRRVFGGALVRPQTVMKEFARWLCQFPKPKLFAGPTSFDVAYVRYYWDEFIGPDTEKMVHNALDARSVVWALTGRFEGDWIEWVYAVTQEDRPTNTQQHFALADAREQAQALFSLLRWAKSIGKVDWL